MHNSHSSNSRLGRHLLTVLAALLALIASLGANAAPIILTNAVQTITLDSGQILSNGSNVAYHPIYDRYYSSKIGGGDPFFAFDGTGTLVQSVGGINGIPSRAINYNSNTGNLEAVTFNAKSNSTTTQGLLTLGLDGSGDYTGGSTEVLATVSGIQNSQPIVAYDSASTRLFSLGGPGTNTVNVIDRANGVLQSTIVLDLSGLGAVGLAYYAIGFDETHDVLVSYDSIGRRALAHDLSGTLLGASSLPAGSNDPIGYNVGYANDQFFVHDRGVWQGFRVFAASTSVPEPGTGVLLLSALAVVLTGRRRR